MARRVLLLLAALVAALVVAGAVNDADLTERVQRNHVLDRFEAVDIPNTEGVNDPAVFLPMLEKAAQESGVNVFRKVSGWSSADRPFVAYYAVFGADRTNFFDAFNLEDRQIADEIVAGSHDWLLATSDFALDRRAQHALGDVAINDECVIAPLALLYDTAPVAGTYNIEGRSEEAADKFVSVLEKEAVSQGWSINLSVSYDFANDYNAGEVQDPILLLLIVLSVLLLMVSIVYCQLNDANRHAVLQLMGSGIVRIWFYTVGQLLCAAFCCLLVAGCAAVLLVPGSTDALVFQVAIKLSTVFAFVLVASLATTYLTRPAKVFSALKGRKDTRFLAASCLVAKGVFALMLFGMLGSILTQQQAIEEQQSKYANWEQSAKYGIFFPLTMGYDGSNLFAQVIPSIVFDLYPQAVKAGALYVDASQFTQQALQNPVELRTMVINPNYLLEYPVIDKQGNPVVVKEDEERRIVLVPEARRSDEQDIAEKLQRQEDPNGEGRTRWDADKDWAGRTIENHPMDQEVCIVWIKDGQEIFAFDPDVAPENGGKVVDPILEVITLANSSGLDRANAVTGGMGSAMKIRLDEVNPSSTYEEYRDLLKTLGLDDNLKQVVSVEDAVFETLKGFRDAQAQLLWQGVAILLVSLVLAAQTAVLLLNSNVRKAAVKRLYGYGFFYREGMPLGIYVLFWLIVAIAMAVMSRTSFWTVESSQLLPLLFGESMLVVLDALIFVGALMAVEGRLVMGVLKKEH